MNKAFLGKYRTEGDFIVAFPCGEVCGAVWGRRGDE
jgi:hypothetical protein